MVFVIVWSVLYLYSVGLSVFTGIDVLYVAVCGYNYCSILCWQFVVTVIVVHFVVECG